MLDLAATIALTHHERWDGKGYPRGLAGEAIPLEGRIAAVADVFDALTTDRVYRPALSVEEALRMMRDERGTQFDPLVLDALLAVVQDAQEHETVERCSRRQSTTRSTDAVVEEVQTGAGPGRRRRISDRELRKACRAAERAFGPAAGATRSRRRSRRSARPSRAGCSRASTRSSTIASGSSPSTATSRCATGSRSTTA